MALEEERFVLSSQLGWLKMATWNELGPRVSAAVNGLLDGLDLENVSVKEMREKLAVHLNLEADGLESHKDEVAKILQSAVRSRACPEGLPASLPEELQPAAPARMVYLCTISRVLPAALEISDLKDIRPACNGSSTFSASLFVCAKRLKTKQPMFFCRNAWAVVW